MSLWFQSTPSLRRATVRIPPHRIQRISFNPRPPCGERRMTCRAACPLRPFQSTPSLRRATGSQQCFILPGQGFNPRPPCGERQGFAVIGMYSGLFQSTPSLRRATAWQILVQFLFGVSIHALLAESDHQVAADGQGHPGFNPRPPCGERLKKSVKSALTYRFNPRPPCGERPVS